MAVLIVQLLLTGHYWPFYDTLGLILLSHSTGGNEKRVSIRPLHACSLDTRRPRADITEQSFYLSLCVLHHKTGGGPRVVVSTAAFHARVRGSVPGLGGLKETKMFLPHPRVKVSIVGSLRDREVACSASDRQGSNFESCVWRTVSSQSSHHPQEVLLAQFSLYVHKGGLKPDSFHFCITKLTVWYQLFAIC